MTTRDTTILAAAFAVLAMVGFVFLAGDRSDGADQPPPSNVDGPAATSDQDPSIPRAIGVESNDSPEAAEDATGPERSEEFDDGQVPEFGRVVGDIQVDAKIFSQLKTVSVELSESRSSLTTEASRPYRKIVGLNVDRGTPTFEFRGVPFSPYGYTVTAYAPRLNGSSMAVAVTKEKPLAEVLLSLSAGVPFGIMLRDQDRAPVANTYVTIASLGEPRGRGSRNGTTDAYGSIVWQDVLAGDYRVFVGDVNTPLVDPVDVMVQAVSGRTTAIPQIQSATVEVRKGDPLKVVVTAFGYGVAEAKLSVLDTDSRTYKKIEGVTDAQGKFEFGRLSAGRYVISVEHPEYQRRSVSVSWSGDAPPPTKTIQLKRLQ